MNAQQLIDQQTERLSMVRTNYNAIVVELHNAEKKFDEIAEQFEIGSEDRETQLDCLDIAWAYECELQHTLDLARKYGSKK